MIEFRWVKVGMDHKNYNDSVAREVYHFDGPPLEIHTVDVVLQSRYRQDAKDGSYEWTEWNTVPFDDSVTL